MKSTGRKIAGAVKRSETILSKEMAMARCGAAVRLDVQKGFFMAPVPICLKTIPKRPKAPQSKRLLSVSFMYVIACGEFHKIGITSKLDFRLDALQACNPLPLRLAVTRKLHSNDVLFYERVVHTILRNYRLHGEWFDAPLSLILEACELAVLPIKDRAEKQVAWFEERAADPKWDGPLRRDHGMFLAQAPGVTRLSDVHKNYAALAFPRSLGVLPSPLALCSRGVHG